MRSYATTLLLSFVGTYAGRAFYEWRQRRKVFRKVRGILSPDLKKGR